MNICAGLALNSFLTKNCSDQTCRENNSIHVIFNNM